MGLCFSKGNGNRQEPNGYSSYQRPPHYEPTKHSPPPSHQQPHQQATQTQPESRYAPPSPLKPTPKPQPVVQPDTILGKPYSDVRSFYTLGKELGRGQFGVTYLCTENATGLSYACKSISKRKLQNKNDREDIKREIQIMQHLTGQANIVEFKGAYEDRQSVNLVMELCAGGELFDRIIAKGHYTEKAAAGICRAIVNVVNICHFMGVMHRDLKPENFLLATKAEGAMLKATDFGLSVFIDEGKVYRDIVGSAYYVAPEVLRRSYGKAIDIWSAALPICIPTETGWDLASKGHLVLRFIKKEATFEAPPVNFLAFSSFIAQEIVFKVMGIGLILFLFLYLLPGILSEEPPDVTIIVRGSSTIAQTNDDFVCATLDWWPPEKCNYNQCPWGQASALNLDLHHPFLANAIQAFKPLRIRVGGSLQDQLVYDVGKLGYPCKPFSKIAGGLFGFSKGCLSMARWDALNLLFNRTGAIVTFGLNALRGRHHVRNNIWGGAWNSSNARDFIQYTISKGYPVDSWEFGNELSGHGIGASVGAELYGNDVIHLNSILDEVYRNSSSRPLLVAPGGFYEQQWYSQLLQVSGSGVVNAMTHHIYNLGAGDDPNVKNRILDPKYLNRAADTFRDLQLTVKRHGPWSSAWVGEAGGAYNSGSRLVSNAFLNSLWYLDQFGMASKYDTKVYCRQTLIGGNYGLLDTHTFVPNPDYYSALLWHRIMGKGVLSIDLSGSPYLRAYAHCRKKKGGVALLLINLSKSTKFGVSVRNDINVDLAEAGISKEDSFVRGLKGTVSWVGRKASDGSQKREEYHLTAKDGNHLGRTMLLNGNPLELTEDGNIPALNPVLVPVNSPISVAPLSIAFVVFPNFEARACV